MKTGYQTLLLSIFSILFLTIPNEVFAQKGKYDKAVTENTIEAYTKFLNKFSQSEYKEDVERRLCILKYEEAKKTNTKDVFEKYIDECPNGYVALAELKIMDLIYAEVEKKNSLDSYYEFISEYPASGHTMMAKEKIMEIRYQQLKIDNNYEEYSVFKNEFPETPYTEEIDNKLSEKEILVYFEIDIYGNQTLKYFVDSELVSSSNPRIDYEKFYKHIEKIAEGKSILRVKYTQKKHMSDAGGKPSNFIEELKKMAIEKDMPLIVASIAIRMPQLEQVHIYYHCDYEWLNRQYDINVIKESFLNIMTKLLKGEDIQENQKSNLENINITVKSKWRKY